jgi:hypothetical protein
MVSNRWVSVKVALLVMIPTALVLLGSLFIYYRYLVLTNTIRILTEKVEKLEVENYGLTVNLDKVQRDFYIYKNGLVDISFPGNSENLTPQVTGFISQYIKDSDVAGSNVITYKDQTARHISTNLSDLGVEKSYTISFSEFIYDGEPYFTLFTTHPLLYTSTATPVLLDLQPKDYVFTTTQGLKVYRRSFGLGVSYITIFTPSTDRKLRLIELGYSLPLNYSSSDEIAAKKKIVDVFNSLEIQ